MLKTHIQTIELSSASSTITFNNIPQTFTDLLLVFSVRTDNTNVSFSNTELLINNSSSNFTSRRMFGGGSGAGESYTATNLAGLVSSAGATSNTFGSTSIYFPNYTSNTNKSYSIDSVSENNGTSAYQEIIAGLWSQTAAITSLTIRGESGRNFVQFSSASLYGVRRGTAGQVEVASGGAVTTAGGYTYHTFTSSGTFVANELLQADVLVVAGGGSGGYDRGSGGGAGGYLASSFGIPSGSYLVTVGAGGSAQTGYTQNNPGNNSQLLSLVSIGGGSGRDGSAGAGRAGGSGSGGASGPFGAGGAGTAGQGNAGGNTGSSSGGSGGGGGAGAAGANGGLANGTGGAGGNGLTWLNGTTYAGGGGGGAAMDFNSPRAGGAGGTGGGGAGGNTNGAAGVAGTANTGGGGGGGANIAQGNGGAGGSGIVIVRYLTPA